jgi:hypothetical protein
MEIVCYSKVSHREAIALETHQTWHGSLPHQRLHITDSLGALAKLSLHRPKYTYSSS